MRLGVLITVIALALLMIAATIGPYFVPTTTYQNVIEDALTERLDAGVVIDDFRLRLIPYPGYTIKGFKLISKSPPFQGMHAVTAKKISGSLRLAALLKGDFDTAVEARDVVINYRSQSGVSNIGMMLGITSERVAPEISTTPALPPPAEESKTLPEGAPEEPSLEEIPAMPAPAIELPADKGEVSLKRMMGDGLMRSARAESSAEEVLSSDEKLNLRKIEVVRGRIIIDAESGVKPLVIDAVSLSAKDLGVAKGLGAKVDLTGVLGDALRPNLKVQGQIFADRTRQEIGGRDIRAYLNGAQLVADISANLGVRPPSYDIHVAALNLNPDAFAPLLSFVGKKLPLELSWQGSIGADVSFKGTRDTGELDLQLDATQARVLAGKETVKEPGIALKAQANVLVKPDAYAIDRGYLTLAGSDINIKGDIVRDEDIKARLNFLGKGLSLTAMQTILPWLSDIGSLEEGGIDLIVEGPLQRSKELNVEGKIEASKAELAGMSLSDVSASFVREHEKISFITLNGKFADANLSGNGSIQFGTSPGMNFDVVIKDVEAENIPMIRNAISGKASLVVNAQSKGQDRDSLIKNLILSGSIVSPDIKINGFEGAAGAFSKDTWSEIESITKATLQEAPEKELENAGDEVLDLRASFEVKDDVLELSEVSWNAEKYSSLLKATVSPTGEIAAHGALVVEDRLSGKIVIDAQTKEKLLKKGKLIIPVIGSGKLGDPNLKLDSANLIALIEDRLKPKPEIVKEEIVKPEVVKEEVVKEEAVKEEAVKEEEKKEVEVKKVEPKKAAAPPKARRRIPTEKTPARKARDQDVEDILKVIIGQ